jgi:gamma-glutamyltranspeptidase/glutathione hydrolase
MKFNFQNPYPSIRLPVFARNVVSTSHPLAAQAGLEILRQGGNAIDAAVAAAAVMTVVEPVSCGLGGDLFAIVWDGKQLQGLNASGRAPKAWTPEYFEKKVGANAGTVPKRGIDSVTVPGMVAGWAALSERLGHLDFAQLMSPAAEVAERGYLMPVVVQQKWAAGAAELAGSPGFDASFLPWGRAPQVGELFQFKAAAKALALIGATKGRAFYEGAIAQALVAFSQREGGAMSAQDLAAYRPEWVGTISQAYQGYELHEIPPNGQGIAALMALGMLAHFDLQQYPVDSAEAQHLQIEAMKLAFADVYAHVAEPGAMQVSAAQMLEPDYLQSRAALINPNKAQVFGAGNMAKGGTIYLSACDESGMMVSLIQSNYMGFGSGCVEPTFGISLQNRGHSFSLNPAHPNHVAPGKRPFHTIIPAFLTRQGQPVMSFGVMGANMQPQGHLQTLVRMLDYGQNPQAACDAPRWRYNSGLDLNVETAMAPSVVQGLLDKGHVLTTIADSYQDFGAGQFIWRMGDPAVEGYVAASDPRRDGLAAGF